MKCEPERGGPCRRCRISKTECVFKPQVNARQPDAEIQPPNFSGSEDTSPAVLARLAAIETVLGIRGGPASPTLSALSSNRTFGAAQIGEDEGDPVLSGLWQATANLRRFTDPQNVKVWSRSVVSQLWFSFYANMEGLHFQSEKEASKNPTPLLLAAILYVSSLHHTSRDLAVLAPEYFLATCSAIAELSIPSALRRSGNMQIDKNLPPSTAEQNAFQNVLGLILAGLISEAFVDLTGTWIAIAYRLTLDHCPVYIDEIASKWRQLFSGLQIIDLEHASLHLSCTVIPLKAPLPSLRQLQSFSEDPFYRLTEMMHTGLGYFTGRGLPTIWSFVSPSQEEGGVTYNFPFTDTDAQVIREWAKNLDGWLVSSNRPTNTEYEKIQIRRQYNLHRLLVLSIYHPARGFDLFANNVASAERHELLLSARATLRMQNDDQGIWANWDLVMITWAAILVLQGLDGGVGEHGDLMLVQGHLNKLQRTLRPAPSLHHTLAHRLKTWLQNMHTPPTSFLPQPEFNPSWSLFDQNSIQLASGPYYQQETSDSWPSNIYTRLFGNVAMEQTGNDVNNLQ
ncbi:hypothetical protein P154DRAFT_543412 [Amniculicola lignicola CBS 123094]|uniref:Zn(2)-C6 fungal-type domain-containing protein n=1 Tax=Amniculicola lignicola CBS 123094 TaxID=1392246 RepID=A0A6A5WQW6_9PLEO|nr:hypothetical protein P154DRAFT_543412 [Amniculicola lignicola CBS 123094]